MRDDITVSEDDTMLMIWIGYKPLIYGSFSVPKSSWGIHLVSQYLIMFIDKGGFKNVKKSQYIVGVGRDMQGTVGFIGIGGHKNGYLVKIGDI
jgi:hypothetical protein